MTYRENDKKRMLEFLRKYPGLHTISSDSRTRRAALSLENDGLIKIVKWETSSWQVKSKNIKIYSVE